MEILMVNDFIPSEGRTLVRKATLDNQPKKRESGLLLPSDSNTETVIHCEVVSSTLEDVGTGDTVVVLPIDTATKISLNGESFIILDNAKVLGKVTKA